MSSMSYVLPGALLAMLGFALFFGLLAAQGALAKSRQFAALGDVLSGRAGAGRRRLAIVAFLCMGFGACGAFVGVSVGDRKACETFCTGRGYQRATLRPSTARNPKNPGQAAFRACACEGGPDPDPLEVVATQIPAR